MAFSYGATKIPRYCDPGELFLAPSLLPWPLGCAIIKKSLIEKAISGWVFIQILLAQKKLPSKATRFSGVPCDTKKSVWRGVCPFSFGRAEYVLTLPENHGRGSLEANLATELEMQKSGAQMTFSKTNDFFLWRIRAQDSTKGATKDIAWVTVPCFLGCTIRKSHFGRSRVSL